MLTYFCKEKQAALQAPAFRGASYRFSDSSCILNPAAGRKKKHHKRTWVVSFTTHSKTFKSAPAWKGNPRRTTLRLRGHVTVVGESGAASPLRPTGTLPRDGDPPQGQGPAPLGQGRPRAPSNAGRSSQKGVFSKHRTRTSSIQQDRMFSCF